MARRPEVATGERPRRAWPVRAGAWLIRPFWTPLVSGFADPPPPPPSWRTPAWLQPLGRRLRLPRVDLLIAGEILVAIVIFASTLVQLNDANSHAGTPVGDGEVLIFAAAAASLPLLLRDRWPLAAWRVALPSMILVAVVAGRIYSYPDAPEQHLPPYGAGAMYLLVLYAVGVRCSRLVCIGAWLCSVLALLVFYPSQLFFLGVVLAAVPLLFGYNVRARRQAQRQVVEEEQRTEDERAARAVLAERSRIARELHDVVAHHMSVIAIQAEAAPIKAPADPAVLREELASIRVTALEALTELRRILGVLREGTEPADTTPQPDLADLDQLVASTRAAGLPVTVTVTGRPPAALGGVGLAAYRVLQESLSNVLRHAPGAAVRVRLAYQQDQLSLAVENDPPARPTGPGRGRGGQGLPGMRERVGAFGGTLTTGPTEAGGFAVAVTLPVGATTKAGQP